MALADVLRERVSRRGRTAEVACGLLGTVTVEALPPRECAALGLRDGGRALLYAACRDLQTAGETLRREGRLFTPAEVTAYVSDEEAAAAARTVMALSGVTTSGDGPSTKSAEVRLGDVQKDGAHLAVEAPSEEEIRLDGVQENTVQKAKVRLGDVRNDAPHFAANAPVAGEFRLADVQENGNLTGKVRLGDVRKPDGTAEDGQVSHEFFSGDGSDRTAPILGGVSDFVPQNLALSEENDRFSAPLELSGNTGEVSGRGSNLHETESEVGEAVHETKSEFAAARRRGLHESKSEVEETLHEMKSEVRETVHETKSELTAERQEGLHESRSEVGETMHETKSDSAAERRRGLHESRSEVGEAVHKTKSESVERFAEGLLEGLRRAAAVR
jgi:F0F1-type ATP synthase membrane subunit b/b'